MPKTADGAVEMVRLLRVTRRSAIKQRTQALNQLQSLADTAADELRAKVRRLRYRQLIESASRFRPTPVHHSHRHGEARDGRLRPPHPSP